MAFVAVSDIEFKQIVEQFRAEIFQLLALGPTWSCDITIILCYDQNFSLRHGHTI